MENVDRVRGGNRTCYKLRKRNVNDNAEQTNPRAITSGTTIKEHCPFVIHVFPGKIDSADIHISQLHKNNQLPVIPYEFLCSYKSLPMVISYVPIVGLLLRSLLRPREEC